MEKKQSSIDWLENEFASLYFDYLTGLIDNKEYNERHKVIMEQAKAMHKEEIEDALEAGYQIANEDVKFKHIHTAEQYYNEAFGETKN